jgi:methylthioribose-1-phosphate isomerase
MPVTIHDVIDLRNGALRFIDQTLLPRELRFIETRDPAVVLDAIGRLQIRGAPLIGIAAAYGIYLASSENDHFRSRLHASCNSFAAVRPTAVNLSWAVRQCLSVIDKAAFADECREGLLSLAETIHRDEIERCERIAEMGSSLIPAHANVLTHCNTGMLATGGMGTALGVILHAHRQNKNIHVYADETRPLLQGARLTTWECAQLGIPCTLITDSTAAFLMARKQIDLVITGADRIAANGDTANKIGTYGLAVLARHHGIPFYIAAPSSSIDRETATGAEITIEERPDDEVTHVNGAQMAADCAVYSPAFDITPEELITGIITEYRILTPPYSETIAKFRT